MPFDSAPAVAITRTRKMLVADLFCGAGGSSTGARDALAALGLGMELVAVNHWDVAIATHTINHPEARHWCADLEAAKPRELVPEGRLDLLMASPACTFHSRARGGRPVHDQQRMDPWYVVRWLTDLRVTRILIENVPEFVEWGPCDLRTGKPIKRRKGEYFRAWVAAIEALGFKVDWRISNAADFGEATTRRRFFLIGRCDGRRLKWPQPTHAPAGQMLGLTPWRPARDIIDWTIPGRSISNRKKPLAAKTLARCYAGAVKFRWPEPFLVILRNHMAAQSVDAPLPTIAAEGNHIGLAMPFVATVAHGNEVGDIGADARRCRSIDDPLQTIQAGGGKFAIAQPFILSQASGGAPRSVEHPVPTIVAGSAGGTGGQVALIAPYYGSGSGDTAQSIADPLPTATAKARFGLVVPVTNSGGGPGPRSIAEPLPTLTTAKGGEFAMVMPVTHHGTDDRAKDLGQPLPTVTGANRGELAFIAASFGERDGQKPRVHSLGAPTPTICAEGRINLVAPASDGETYDILFRMLEPHELAAAMGFDDYRFAGNKTEITKQIGNAVSRRQAQALVGALFA